MFFSSTHRLDVGKGVILGKHFRETLMRPEGLVGFVGYRLHGWEISEQQMRERTEPSLKPDHKCQTKKTIMMKIQFAILFVDDLLMSFYRTRVRSLVMLVTN